MTYKSFRGGLVAVLLALATASPTLAQTSKSQQLKVAVSTATPHNTPLWVARDKKIFDKYGVEVQLIFVMGGALVSQMLAAGEIQVAANAPAALLSLIANGVDISMFLGVSNTSPFALISRSNI
jgi:ABC-type nitrate/sulfonate/bicarbonate transport system substrate-binding protein